jgi:hypothetical protein
LSKKDSQCGVFVCQCRARAVECIGLYAMAGASKPWLVTAAVQLLGPLLLTGSCYATKRAAVRALTDLALLLRPATVDAVLRGPRAAASAADTTAAAAAGQEAEDDTDSSGAAGSAADGLSAGLSRGLLELLFEQAEVLLAEAQAPAAKPKRGGRWVWLTAIALALLLLCCGGRGERKMCCFLQSDQTACRVADKVVCCACAIP